ncbi:MULTISPECIES: GNAT family N-acetyltransferase [unclassified Lentimicrobium]|uniref:GNAT family N-acetyltransferase n=1 Tax=unclassified Lentimicrobium TaxID=2677434 RepID=UPI00155596FE|nr:MULTISPECIES: GNAT family N-acetyltransferase [unclassified Lentimicrobium]NPD47266.1 GNAT family N-acetyltransferase [Lentimicrobium sp. S6]NPD86645.1 GNAT family N-acetyltransferase [Lentimicrobium sp. L6]
MTTINYQVKTISRSQLDMVIDWATQEGWNPGLHDIDAYYAADKNGFLIGYLNGEAIASISVIKYDDTFGFLGFYMVKPKYRGQGYGYKIWQAGMQYLKGCNIGLDGVVEQQENYKKTGFRLAYNNIRFQGKGSGESIENTRITSLNQVTLKQIKKFENHFFPVPRPKFIEKWIQMPASYGYAILEDGDIKAYGVMRKCREGYKIAPLFAEKAEQANELFEIFKSHAQTNEHIYLDVPEINNEALSLAKRYHMTEIFQTARMYTGEIPKLPIEKIFGITSFEIG